MQPEVESRYLVPDRTLFDRLCASKYLGGLRLSRKEILRLRDTYLDTPGRALQRQGWACRVRRCGDVSTVTLKGPRQTRGSIVERAQWEQELAGHTIHVEAWPVGELRERVLNLTGGTALIELVRLRQTRLSARMSDGDRTVGELSLDIVEMNGKELGHTSLMLEAELRDAGTRDDLEQLDRILVTEYGLVPEPRSKLQRALALVETGEQLDAGLWRRVQPASPRTVAARYGADLDRSGRAAEMAARLVQLLEPAASLSTHGQALLQASAWLHDLGRQMESDDRERVVRDLVLRQPLIGLDDHDRELIALAVTLRRGPVTPERVAGLVSPAWDPENKQEALQVAALLRIAVALARALPDAQALLEARPVSAGLRLVLHVPGDETRAARKAARRAARRADLWGMISDVRLEWAAVRPSEDGEALMLARPARILGVNPWDAMPTAAYKILAFYTQQMLDHEAGTRLGLDPEELHAMRVATRRLRSALRLLRPYLGTTLGDPLNESLRRLARLLGNVRDMDVALARLEAYRQQRSDTDAAGLEPLRTFWGRRRERTHTALVRYLDGPGYQRLQHHAAVLLATLQRTERQAPEERQAGQVAPRMVYLYWQATRAYSVVLPHAPAELLHLLRIDCKRLRFALEFFVDVLPAQVTALVDEIVALQDHLGSMRDDIVAMEMLDAYLAHPRLRRTQQAVAGYRAACDASRQTLAEHFATVWDRLDDRMSHDMSSLGLSRV